jgi:hypothetical protein
MDRMLGQRVVVFAALFFIGSVIVTPNSVAQERRKATWSASGENTKYTAQHALEVLDVPGHLIRLFEMNYWFQK